MASLEFLTKKKTVLYYFLLIILIKSLLKLLNYLNLKVLLKVLKSLRVLNTLGFKGRNNADTSSPDKLMSLTKFKHYQKKQFTLWESGFSNAIYAIVT